MKRIGYLLLVTTFTAASLYAAENKPRQANCELRLVSQADASGSAGEIFLSIFSPSKEECLSKSDGFVEAQYRGPAGTIVGKRGGAGPQP